MSIFDSINTIESLQKEKQGNDNFLDDLKRQLLNIDNISQVTSDVVSWFNNLFEDYNKLFIDYNSNPNREAENYNNYSILVFEVIDSFLDFLPIQGQIYALTNKCILSDDKKIIKTDGKPINFYKENFEKSLREANSLLIEEWKENKAIKIEEEIYKSLGFINFEAHNYHESEYYLDIYINILLENGLSNDQEVRRFVSAKMYLANCFEYLAYCDDNNTLFSKNGDSLVKKRGLVAKALEHLLGLEKDQLLSTIINNVEEINNKIINLYKNPLKNCTYNDILTILTLISKNDYQMHKIFSITKDQATIEIKDEYIHITAHCISEYAGTLVFDGNQSNQDFYPLCSIMQIISRFLLDWLVAQGNKKYITCQATVRAENDACPEAIDLLVKHVSHYESLSEDNDNPVSDEEAELQFYIFYFAEQEMRSVFDNQNLLNTFNTYRKKFLSYAQEKNDDDAKFHYYVIYFRFLLKNMADIVLRPKNSHKNNKNFDEREIDNAYIQLIECRTKISKHVFQPLKDECTRLIKLYKIFTQIRNLDLISNKDNPQVELALLLCVNGVISTDKLDDAREYPKAIERIYTEIVERKKILILAPVHDAPSCSFTVRNINDLLKIQIKSFDMPNLESHNVLTNLIKRRDRSYRNKLVYLHVNEVLNKILKWAVLYTDKKLYLFYSNFNSYGDKCMFPVILNKNEESRISTILEALTGFDNKGICDNPIDDCITSYDICHSRVYNLKNNNNIYNELLKLLVFLEFDFSILNKNNEQIPRLNDDDVVFIYHKDNEYKIVGYSNIEVNETNQLCKKYGFTTSSFNSTSSSDKESNQSNHSCKHNINWFTECRRKIAMRTTQNDQKGFTMYQSTSIALSKVSEQLAICEVGEHFNDKCNTTCCDLENLMSDQALADLFIHE